MSLLADLLSKIKQPQSKREVPPNLKSIVQNYSKGSDQKKKMIILAVILAVSVSAGFFLVHFLQSISGSPVSNINTISPEMIASSESRRLVDTSVVGRENKTGLKSLNKPERKQQPAAIPPLEARDNSDHTLLSKKSSVKKPAPIKEQSKPVHSSPNKKTANKAPLEKKKPAPEKKYQGTAERDAYLYSAREFETKKDYSNALASYRKALDKDKRNFNIMNNIAYIYLQLGLYEDSVIYSQMALEINENYTPALINLGIAYAGSGKVTEAEDLLKRAAALEPDNQPVFFNLAVLNERQDNYDEASAYYSHLIKLGDARGSLGLARIYEKQDMPEEALQLYKNVYALDSIDSSTKLEAKKRIYILLNAKR
jgi:TolA-binding protein